jgi:hypothetical protein
MIVILTLSSVVFFVLTMLSTSRLHVDLREPSTLALLACKFKGKSDQQRPDRTNRDAGQTAHWRRTMYVAIANDGGSHLSFVEYCDMNTYHLYMA